MKSVTSATTYGFTLFSYYVICLFSDLFFEFLRAFRGTVALSLSSFTVAVVMVFSASCLVRSLVYCHKKFKYRRTATLVAVLLICNGYMSVAALLALSVFVLVGDDTSCNGDDGIVAAYEVSPSALSFASCVTLIYVSTSPLCTLSTQLLFSFGLLSASLFVISSLISPLTVSFILLTFVLSVLFYSIFILRLPRFAGCTTVFAIFANVFVLPLMVIRWLVFAFFRVVSIGKSSVSCCGGSKTLPSYARHRCCKIVAALVCSLCGNGDLSGG